ncbi:MAG: L-seryl-tRNA(Sec) selenium transferase, partial [Cyanobacteria bacterium HKST-UBA02]|nr:L-seryl-tRNA(Sec) selenium transferase [Cyanobacteria bacterium HKST-UBA02]
MRLPQVDLVLRQPVLEELVSVIDRSYLTVLVREELARLREGLRSAGGESPEAEVIAGKVAVSARALLSGGLERVINATGVVLNTNLGRAPLPESVLAAMKEIGSGYSSLEIDLESGKRGERTRRTSRLLGLLTGSEMAIVVNNNASSVMLAVAALANGEEVIVSRGELIEIGGSFRLPDVIAGAGGTLKEVGTTNKTRLSDYRNAINDRTGMILKCHRSNFEITGFTEEAGLEELVSLSRESGVPVVEDLGSGAFFDMSRFGLQREPTVRDSIEAGAGLVLFSGDKLLGGPQAGIAAGSRALVEKLRKNPMYRALRADKLVIAILENVLSLYLSPHPEKEVAVLAL